MGNNYVDKNVFNAEMLKCIDKGELTNKSIEIFRLIATEVSRTFNFKYPEEKSDAIDNAVLDFASNWRGYRYKPVFKVKIKRNFVEGDYFEITIPNHKKITVFAKDNPSHYSHFKIEETENKSLQNMANLVENLFDNSISCYLHKVTKKIALVDNINAIGKYGNVKIYTSHKTHINSFKKIDENNAAIINFSEPPPAFNWATSVARNGIIKSIDKMRPKHFRRGKMMNFSEIVAKKGGTFGN